MKEEFAGDAAKRHAESLLRGEVFELDRSPKPETWRPVPAEKRRQKTLFSGMSCAEDQLDLFPTDGKEEEEQSSG